MIATDDEALWLFARMCALRVLHFWGVRGSGFGPSEKVWRYLETGVEDLRESAYREASAQPIGAMSYPGGRAVFAVMAAARRGGRFDTAAGAAAGAFDCAARADRCESEAAEVAHAIEETRKEGRRPTVPRAVREWLDACPDEPEAVTQ